MSNVLIVIPARMDSRRLPGKPLRKVSENQTMLDRILSAARDSRLGPYVVATSDDEILEYCDRVGVNAVKTRADHATGTHRVAEAAGKVPGADLVMNLQVDEVDVTADELRQLVGFMWAFPKARIATPVYDDWATALDDSHDQSVFVPENENITKAAVSLSGVCCWFSRKPIGGFSAAGHHGIYVYRRETLRALGELGETPMSKAERLEQLAWIEHGYAIHAVHTGRWVTAINTEEDLERYRSERK